MRVINYNALYGFWLVAEHGSFAAAARNLPWGSVQSLHKRVRQLESKENLDLMLFKSRGVRGTELTECGRRLHDFLNPVFKSLDVLLAELRGEDRGRLAVAMTSYIVQNYAEHLLGEFRSAFPNVALRLYTGDAAAVVSMVEAGYADFGICPPLTSAKRLLVGARAPIRFEILASPDWRLEKRPVTWKKLVEKPFVVTDRSSMTRQALEQLLRRQNLLSKLHIAAEVSNLDLMIDAVRAGFGIALFPVGPRTAGDLQGLSRRNPPPGVPRIDNAVLWRSDVYLPRYMRGFAQLAKKFLGCERRAAPKQRSFNRESLRAQLD
jgi:DNA-binding transcriptional LysR family regulator